MGTTKGTERRTIRLDAQLTKKIDQMASEENRSFNNMVETLLFKQTARYVPFG